MNTVVKTKVAFGCDHAGYAAKEVIIDFLKDSGAYEVMDFGTDSPDSVDYPDFVHPVAKAVRDGVAAWGILCCGSGNGVAITANKYQEIRAALAWKKELAILGRQHNNANIVCLPVRFITQDDAVDIVKAFSTAAFEGGRHARRVDKITHC